ncbi:MAG: CDP-glucose 4,6-dehydratase [Deltaproteobacteria bacterium]|nr:CDP-glucose 4,6-dehydratase [Deltaproteobacteria bacterium]
MPFSFFRDKRVFLTGHTGFKGSWLARALTRAGARLTGYALAPDPDGPSLYGILGLEGRMTSVIGDVRDFDALLGSFREAEPEYVIHMAAQPLVQEGYREPRGTYETNVMGTVNLLECLRQWPSWRSFLNVTTDKVYRNNEWAWGYRETDTLGGRDPYSSSKACSELATASWRDSFFGDGSHAVSTARAGNVIGGGDFARDRLVPDLFRAWAAKRPALLRNPDSLRPYQHVLDALSAYLLILKAQDENPSLSGAYNVGPEGCLATRRLAALMAYHWGEGASSVTEDDPPQGRAAYGREAGALMLDGSLIRRLLGRKAVWDIGKAALMTVDWEKARLAGYDMGLETDRQIGLYEAGFSGDTDSEGTA